MGHKAFLGTEGPERSVLCVALSYSFRMKKSSPPSPVMGAWDDGFFWGAVRWKVAGKN